MLRKPGPAADLDVVDWDRRIDEWPRATGRALVRIDREMAVFLHRERTRIPAEPEQDTAAISHVAWSTMVFLCCWWLWFKAGVKPDRLGAFFLFLLGVFYLFRLRRLVASVRLRRDWRRRRAEALAATTWWAVRFVRATGACRLVGPFPRPEEAVDARTPVAAELPLERYRLHESRYFGIPWSDVYDEGDEPDSINLWLESDVAGRPELSGEFDLTEGLPWSYVGAVGITTPGVAERREAATSILAG